MEVAYPGVQERWEAVLIDSQVKYERVVVLGVTIYEMEIWES